MRRADRYFLSFGGREPLAGTITMIGALSAIVGIETKAMIDNRTQVFDVAMKNARTIEACVDRPPRD